MTILIAGALVLRSSASIPEALDIVVDGEAIADLVAPGSARDANMQRIDATDRLVMPGLINSHHHAQAQLVKGCFDTITLELLLNTQRFTNSHRTLEDKYLSALIGAAELVRKGCTASFDMFAEVPLPSVEGVAAVARAYSEVGMRATIAPMMGDRTFYQVIPGLADAFPAPLREQALAIKGAPHETILGASRQILEGWAFSRDRIRPALGPTIPHHCTDDFLRGCRDLGREFDVGFQMHVSESKMQAVVAKQIYGTTLVAHLDEVGLLSPRFCVAHGVWLDDDDAARLGSHGASVAHNPGSNLKLGSGIADIRKLMDRGVNVAIGTDGSSASDNLNVFEAMRLASYLSRIRGRTVDRWVNSREALHAATEGGARALGFEKMGRIEKGYLADMTFIDLAALHYVPMNDAVTQIVSGEDGTGVDSVMVGGKLILDHGRLLNVDIASMRNKAADAVARLKEANAANRELADKLEPYVNQFCSGLTARPLDVHHFCGHAHSDAHS